MFGVIVRYIKFFIKSQSLSKAMRNYEFLRKLFADVKTVNLQQLVSIEKERQKLLNNEQVIHVTDYGAGSKVHKSNERKISKIAKYSLKPTKQAQLISQIASNQSARNILEIGTSLGITTSYLSAYNSDAKILSLEGCPKQLLIANSVFSNLNINNVHTIQGNFNKTLPQALQQFKHLDFVFFDGNHAFSATQDYYQQCLKLATNNSVFVFDDINLNSEMYRFWQTIIADKKVTLSINLFHLGIVFFSEELSGKDLKIRF